MQLDLSIGAPVARGALTLFPVFHHGAPAPEYLNGARAAALGVLEVVERPGVAVVPELVVRNRGTVPVLVVEGETLIGNKQDRTLNVSVLCPPGEVVVPVSCVEQGRWGLAHPWRRSLRHAPLDLRAVVAAARRGGARMADQRAMWREVAAYAERLRVDTPTGALEDVYTAAEPRLRTFVDEIQPRDGQAGVVVAVGRRIRLLELFDRHETFCDYWRGLLAGYALDALHADTGEERPSADEVLAFLQRVSEAPVTEAEPCGLGRELHLRSPDVYGTALEWDGGVVHLCAFNDEAWDDAGEEPDSGTDEADVERSAPRRLTEPAERWMRWPTVDEPVG